MPSTAYILPPPDAVDGEQEGRRLLRFDDSTVAHKAQSKRVHTNSKFKTVKTPINAGDDVQ